MDADIRQPLYKSQNLRNKHKDVANLIKDEGVDVFEDFVPNSPDKDQPHLEKEWRSAMSCWFIFTPEPVAQA